MTVPAEPEPDSAVGDTDSPSDGFIVVATFQQVSEPRGQFDRRKPARVVRPHTTVDGSSHRVETPQLGCLVLRNNLLTAVLSTVDQPISDERHHRICRSHRVIAVIGEDPDKLGTGAVRHCGTWPQ
jgi:hypothetical protein